MDRVILRVVSKIEACLVDKACVSAISKLSDIVMGLNELPDSLEEIRQELIMFSHLLRQMDTGYPQDHVTVVSWVKELQKMASRVEDMIDKYSHHALDLQGEMPVKKLWTVNRTQYDTDFRKLCDEFMEIENEIKQLSQVKDEWLQPSQPVPSQDSNPTGSPPSLVGADGPMDCLLKFLTDKGMHEELKVLSIGGFAGIGKTALASALYNSLREQYKCSAFVKVSKWHDVDRILRTILREVCQPNHSTNIEDMKETQLVEQIAENLKDKRYAHCCQGDS